MGMTPERACRRMAEIVSAVSGVPAEAIGADQPLAKVVPDATVLVEVFDRIEAEFEIDEQAVEDTLAGVEDVTIRRLVGCVVKR